MRIAFISPEVFPFAKTGGLADVSYSYPKALAKAGHEVCVFMPAYNTIDKEKYNVKLDKAPLIIKMGQEEKYSAILSSDYIPGVQTYFIDYERYFHREGLYGNYYNNAYSDNAERFAFFSKAVIHGLKEINFIPDIIHCNDWQTGLIPVYLKTIYKNDKFFERTAIVLTVHNAGYQGLFPGNNLDMREFNGSEFNFENMEHSYGISYLKGGVLYSDIITTVSRKYAEEIQTPEFGYEMAYVFGMVNDRLYGIPNAVDTEEWDPATDQYLPYRYSAENIADKNKCKAELQKRMGLAVKSQTPILGAISRLTFQKGMDVLADTLELLLQDEDFQFILVGSGDQRIADKFAYLQKMFRQRVGISLEYTEELGHLAEAGLDIYIMPSRYEPCGLNQMYSLRYGTVPVVRATGGLDDIIEEWNDKDKTGNGFKFNNLTHEEIYNTIRKVVKKYKEKNTWKTIQKNGMLGLHGNYSWDDAVREYEKIYNAALENIKNT